MPIQPVTDIRAKSAESNVEIRHNWRFNEVETLFALPFNDLVFHAQTVHRRYFDPNEVQVSTLLSIKTGGMFRGLCVLPTKCPARHRTGEGILNVH